MNQTNTGMKRLESIDMMRGLVMVLMALDHTRDYFANALFAPLDLSQTTPGYFLTRWITHLCAPTFIFLAGASAYLSTGRKGLNSRELSLYLLTRGIWLVILELTLVRFGWTFNWNYSYAIGQVIWVLGWSMFTMAALVRMPRPVIAWVAAILIVGHNAFDNIHANTETIGGWLWIFLHERGIIEYWPGYTFSLYYPLIPWVGVMAAGYWFGPFLLEANRQSVLHWLGLLCLAGFLLLRLGNLYGNPLPWSQQKTALFTLFSIVNVQKYPPSLMFLLLMLGFMFIGLAALEKAKTNRVLHLLAIIGKAPLFFYLLHIYIIHGAALLLTRYRGLPDAWLFTGTADHPFPHLPGAGYGLELSGVYGVWLLIVAFLYPICRQYVLAKQRYRHIVWFRYM